MDWPHAIVSGLLIGAAYWVVRSQGWFENRTKLQQALIFMPIVFVLILIFNLVWPTGGA